MNVLVFDIETVPDLDSGARLHDLDGLSAEAVAEVMFAQRRQQTGGSSDFLRHHLHRVVAIAVLLAAPGKLQVWSLGDEDADERELVQRFFDGIGRYSPQLVSWNGRGFDLPVLHYRALLHGVQAPRYWETGAEDQSFKWNNYLNRFHERHTDLMDVLAGYEGRAVAPLHEIAVMLGLPGKLGMDGSQVWPAVRDGKLRAVRDYCETDVLNTYLVYLRYQLMRGRLNETSWQEECDRVRDLLRADQRPHLQEFLRAWDAAGA